MPFRDQDLPPRLSRLRCKLKAGDEAGQRFMRARAAEFDDGLDRIEAAVREALLAGITSDDVILSIVTRRREPPRLSPSTPEDVPLYRPPRVPQHEMMGSWPSRGSGAWRVPLTRRTPPARSATYDVKILTHLPRPETPHRHAAPVCYRMPVDKLPVAKDLDTVSFDSTPINEDLVRLLYGGSFLAGQCNIVLVRATNTGKDAPRKRHYRQRPAK